MAIKNIVVVLLMLPALGLAAEDEIATDRPDFVESSNVVGKGRFQICLLYTSPSPRDRQKSRMPSSA